MKPTQLKIKVRVEIVGGQYSNKIYGSAERERAGEIDPEDAEKIVRDITTSVLNDAISSLDQSISIAVSRDGEQL